MLSSLCMVIVGCDRSGSEDPPPELGTAGGSGGNQQISCELGTSTMLASPDEVAPNGQSGAALLAAIPDSLQTSLHWDLSTADIVVEVTGATGLSSEVSFGFSLPQEPQFSFEDWVAVDPSGEVQQDLDVTCEDVITTSVDVSVEAEDGTVSLQLMGLRVALGPDDPSTNFVAKPLMLQTLAMATPEVNFLQPEVLSADADKTISIVFDGQSTQGSFIVRAQGSGGEYEHSVAQW